MANFEVVLQEYFINTRNVPQHVLAAMREMSEYQDQLEAKVDVIEGLIESAHQVCDLFDESADLLKAVQKLSEVACKADRLIYIEAKV